MRKLKKFYRELFRNKILTSLFLLSFIIAYCCCILVYLFIADELSYDKHNPNYDITYRLILRSKDKTNASTNHPGALYENLKAIPGIEKYARCWTFMGERYFSLNNNTYSETSFLFADPEFLNIFHFDFLKGNPKEALSNPFNVIISQSMAHKYFGHDDPMGKNINFENHDFMITGVVKDIPAQSHFSMNFIGSVSSFNTINKNLLTEWYMSAFDYYMLLPGDFDKKEIETQLADIVAEGHGIDKTKREFEVYLEPLGDIHLKSVTTLWDNAIKGDLKVIYGFGMISLLILGIAIANYVTFITADLRRRIKETAIKRVNGASRSVIIADQVFETFAFLLAPLLTSVILAYHLIPFVNELSGKSFSINIPVFVLCLVMLTLSVILSVIYPVASLNSIKTSEGLKNQLNIFKIKSWQNQKFIRGTLVTFQLIIAILLIGSTIIINNQLHLVLKSKTGFDDDNILIVKNPYSMEMNERYELFREKLASLPMINGVGVSNNAPAGFINNFSPAWLPDHENMKKDIGQIVVDHDFLDVIGTSFTEGRNFDINASNDNTTSIVINQSTVKEFNLTDPIGKKLVVQNNANTPNNELEIIGVIEDMQYFTLRESAKPVMYYVREWGKHEIAVKLGSGDYTNALMQIETIWKEIAPQWPLSYQFMDDRISQNYKSEINTAKILTGLSGISIFLAILGILGMALCTVNQRGKEIGIRKVNGAKVWEVMTMLNINFIKWAAIALVVASPVTWYSMNRWLQNFAYRTELSWWIFVLAGVITLGIALLTVSWQSWRAARRNPVEALRYE